MRFVEIKDLTNCEDVKQLYEESFPPEEKVDFYGFFSGVFTGFKFFVLYDNNDLIGMVHLNNAKNFVHLNYLAVKKKFQCQGYGSSIIAWVKTKFSNKTIVVDVEEARDGEINNVTRIRRKKFYNQNGLVDGQYVFDWEGTFMTYMHCGAINAEEFMDYIQIIFPTIINVRKK